MITMIRRIFRALLESATLRQGVYPTSADGVAAAAVTLLSAGVAWTWGAWLQIVAATGAETQVVGFTLENFVGGAPAQGEVAIAVGGAGAEVELGRFPIVAPVYMLPKPIKVEAGVRLSGNYRTSTGIADTVDIKLITLTGF
jgi:hypothetical protein